MQKANKDDKLSTMAENSLYERREGRKEVFKLAMRIFNEADADCVSCGGESYETFRVEMKRRAWL